jgi:D-alanyl-D-alanine carboxypeptidase/D-alanyl-D-alanine-endopeptidase (penicillin-binding protein 4)
MRRIRRWRSSAAVVLLACTAVSHPVASGRPTLPPPASSGSAISGSPAPAEPEGPRVRPIEASWIDAIDALVAGRDVAVAVGLGNRIVYLHRGREPRVLASNEKILTSMAALDVFGPRHRFPTVAAADAPVRRGRLEGDLWLIGGGDPGITAGRLASLAVRLDALGVRRITGSIVGDTSAFDRGWWAPGWLPGISRSYVTRPTALAIDGNRGAGSPELRAASALRTALWGLGVEVGGGSAVGRAPEHLRDLAGIRSATLASLVRSQNHDSVNFIAEMLTKALGARVEGTGSTAAGARAIRTWARRWHVRASVRDGSGLSDQDRTSPLAVVTLLLAARRASWGGAFVRSLPRPGEGTLAGRLAGLRLRAKTGTLFVRPASALSGYVRSAAGATFAFSILTSGYGSAEAQPIEDAIVRILARAPMSAPGAPATG